jgi:CheY-like chemotaxis protein
VFGNILGNAIKFTDAGGTIAVSAAIDATQREACVRIVDSGRGINAALMERLFTPFSQGESELARSTGGLGLGLSLVKGLVELHGGRVQAQSDGPGQGAQFIVCLPLGEAPAPGAQVPPAARAPARPLRILLVEDNADAAQTLGALLRLDGHEVQIEHSGPAGLAAARRLRPDVVFCDIGLPGMDGYELARALRADPGLGRPLLVAVTGYATEADQQRTAQAGFDHHFAKPVELARLNALFASL